MSASSSSSFNEIVFRDKLEKCLKKVQRLLQADKAQVLGPADQVPHKYTDKYLLAEQLVGCTAAAVWNTFQALGLNEEQYRQLREWRDEKKAISLRSSFESSCVFVKETTRDEESSHRVETEKAVAGVFREKTTTKVITKITEYHYLFRHHYRMTAFSGADPEAEKVLIVEQEGEQTVVVRNKQPPYAEKTFEAFDTNISWLLDVLPANATSLEFSIDRSADDCHTPRRNKDVESALSCLQDLSQWSQQVASHLTSRVFSVQNSFTEKSKIDLSALVNIEMVFNPVVPLFLNDEAEASEEARATAMEVGEGMIADDEAEAALVPPAAAPSASTSSAVTVSQQPTAQTSQAVLGQSEVCALVNEQSRSLRSRFAKLDALVTTASSSSSTPLITPILAHLALSCFHLVDLSVQLQDGLDYIEFMLRRQLIAAIGRELGPADFANYMNFHYRKLFSEAYAPRAFNYGVRRSNEHSPEGVIRIESDFSNQVLGQPSNLLAMDGVRADSILTFCRQLPSIPRGGSSGSESGNKLMEFALNASTRVRFRGERYVHCWLAHGFSPEARYRPTCGGGGGSDLQASLPKLQLIAQARQFSSYVVLLGRMASKQLFEPKHAFIVQNKDEWRLPLLLDPIPTPKQFRDAIESLSPEQQRFAQAFRAMQIESTLFAVCVVQIKPQLEKVLHLARDSLTKEIRLTQDLMSLFIDYQIPPDLLSFDNLGKRKKPSSSMGEEEADDDSDENGGASPEARLEAVKRHVAAMLEMIAKAKEEEVKEANQQREYEYGRKELRSFELAHTSAHSWRSEECDDDGSNGGMGELVHQSAQLDTSAKQFQRKSKSLLSGGGLLATGASLLSFGSSGSGGGTRERRAVRSPSAAGAYVPPPILPCAAPQTMKQEASFASLPPPPPVPPVPAPSVTPSAEVSQPISNATVDKTSPPREAQQDHSSDDQLAPIGNPEIDVTKLPSLLEDQFSSLDSYNALRPTIINLGPSWSRKRQVALLAKPSANAIPSPVEKVEQESAKQAAFDLLDALTRSGGLELEAVDLHIIVAATHGFDESLMETVIEKNINPIEQVERSALLMASTLHGVSGLDLLAAAGPHRTRLLQLAGEEKEEEVVEGKGSGGRRQEQKQQLRRLLEETSSEKTLPSDRLLLLTQQQQQA